MVDDGSKDLAGSGLNATGAMAVLNIGSFNTFTAIVQSHKPGNASFTYKDTLEPINTSLKTSWNFLTNPRSGFTTKLLEHYL